MANELYKKVDGNRATEIDKTSQVGVFSKLNMSQAGEPSWENDLESRVIVSSASDFGVIDSTKVYRLDGVIDMGSTSITVPPTGITIVGDSFDVSGLISTEDNYTMFVSETSLIGSGDLLGTDFYITTSGTSSKVFELYDATGFNAIEMNRVNYNNCTSLGDLHDYRQGLESGTGRFGGSPSLTLHGVWAGGFRITSSIVRLMSDTTTEPLFKSGTAFQMLSRFLTDINCDLGTLQPLLDFAPSDFFNPSTVQLKGCEITRDGVYNPDDTNITPNIDQTNLVCQWNGNNGLRNTFVGGEGELTTEIETVISTQNISVDVLGTQTMTDLQHFDSPANGQLRFNGNSPSEYSVKWDFVLEGIQNNEYCLELMRDRGGVVTLIHQQIRTINNLQGGRDVAYYSGSHHENLIDGDFTYWKVKNLSGTGNCTLELGSTWDVDAR